MHKHTVNLQCGQQNLRQLGEVKSQVATLCGLERPYGPLNPVVIETVAHQSDLYTCALLVHCL